MNISEFYRENSEFHDGMKHLEKSLLKLMRLQHASTAIISDIQRRIEMIEKRKDEKPANSLQFIVSNNSTLVSCGSVFFFKCNNGISIPIKYR